MKLEIFTKTNAVIAVFSGELDEHSAGDVRKRLDLAIEMSSATNFIFDFENLSFMDSTGIGVLLGRYKKLKSKNINIYIASPSAHVDKILNTAGIYTIMEKIAK